MYRRHLHRVFRAANLKAGLVVATALGGGAMLAATASHPAAAEVKQGLRLAFFASGGDNDYQIAGINAANDTPRSTARPCKSMPRISTMRCNLTRS